MDVKNVHLNNFVYQGGDDCIAVKPRSYNVFANNITCRGGNGIAIGSLGQYLEDSSVENVQVTNVKVMTRYAARSSSRKLTTGEDRDVQRRYAQLRLHQNMGRCPRSPIVL